MTNKRTQNKQPKNSSSKTNKRNIPVVFFGTDDFSSIILEALIKAGYNIQAIVTKADSKSGRGQKMTMPKVKQIALKNGILVLQPDKLVDIYDDIKKLGKNVVGVLASFGKIVPQSITDLFTPGIINIHPSLLPLYRGPSPIESAISNGDSETGISVMLLNNSMDSGPIYSQVKYKLSGHETQPELYNALAKLSAKHLVEVLPNIIEAKIKPKLQDNTQASYCALLNKQDSMINLSNITAKAAERIIRAHLIFPKTKLNILGNTIIITKAHVSDQEQSPIDVLSIDNKYLIIDELVAPSGKTMDARAFINGYKLA